MAARLRLKHQDEVRAKIQASNIIAYLQKHVFGEVEMSPERVTSARILLDKSLPNLTATELTGNPDEPVELKATVEFVRAPTPPDTGEA